MKDEKPHLRRVLGRGDLVLLFVVAVFNLNVVPSIAAKGHSGKGVLTLAGTRGLVTTLLGIALAFFPAQQITSFWMYELKMVGGTLAFIGIAAFFFFVYGRRKASPAVASLAVE